MIKAFKAKDMEGRGELSKVIVRAIIRKQLPKQVGELARERPRKFVSLLICISVSPTASAVSDP